MECKKNYERGKIVEEVGDNLRVKLRAKIVKCIHCVDDVWLHRMKTQYKKYKYNGEDYVNGINKIVWK